MNRSYHSDGINLSSMQDQMQREAAPACMGTGRYRETVFNPWSAGACLPESDRSMPQSATRSLMPLGNVSASFRSGLNNWTSEAPHRLPDQFCARYAERGRSDERSTKKPIHSRPGGRAGLNAASAPWTVITAPFATLMPPVPFGECTTYPSSGTACPP